MAYEGSSILPAEFDALALRMAPTVRQLLVDGAEPSSVLVEDLLADLRVDPKRHLLGDLRAHVMRETDALSATACAALRDAVDRERSMKCDSVDGAAEHELPLNLGSLTALVGNAAARSLCHLPAAYKSWQAEVEREGISKSEASDSSAGGQKAKKKRGGGGAPMIPTDIFVRRYSGETRPWIPFHADSADVTVNVALCADADFDGGRLVAVANGKVATIERAEGEATIHDSRLLHAVTCMRQRVRYSLICFYGKRDVATAEGTEQPRPDAVTPAAMPAGASNAPRTTAPSATTALYAAKRALAAAADAVDDLGRTDDAAACSIEFNALQPHVQRVIDSIVLAQQRASAAHQAVASAPGAAVPGATFAATGAPRLLHVASSLSAGTRVQLSGLSKAVLNGCVGTIADEDAGWTGERYKIDAHAVSAQSLSPQSLRAGGGEGASRNAEPMRVLVRPRNLFTIAMPLPLEGESAAVRVTTAATAADAAAADAAAAAVAAEASHVGVEEEFDPVDVQLRLSPGLMPPASDALRWRTLSEIGYDAHKGRASSASEMDVFELSAADWHVYAASTGEDAQAALMAEGPIDEPASLMQLKLFLLLLVAPAPALTRFMASGKLPDGGQLPGGGALGRCLVSLIDYNDAAAATGAHDEEESSQRQGERQQRQQLSRWRASFCRQYFIPTTNGPSPVECWNHTLLLAARLPVGKMLPREPQQAAVAQRASMKLGAGSDVDTAASASESLPLHVEESWIHGAALEQLREEATAFVRSHCQPAGVGPMEAVDTSVRACSATDLLGPGTASTLPPALLHLTHLLDRLRVELAAACARPLLDVAELQILLYPPGGHCAYIRPSKPCPNLAPRCMPLAPGHVCLSSPCPARRACRLTAIATADATFDLPSRQTVAIWTSGATRRVRSRDRSHFCST